MRGRYLFLAFLLILPACAPYLPDLPTATPRPPTAAPPTASPTPLRPTLTASPTLPPLTPSPTPLPLHLGLDPADWKSWPVLPIVPERARQIYLQGQALGNDPHAFSVFGDCQSEPEQFWGPYDSDPAARAALPPDLQETAAWFAGSFSRRSPTVRGGTTAGALLWTEWHEGMYGCSFSETPVDCELRLHRPSFVFIHVGTHWEARNINYLREIIEQLMDAGVVPILVTKADNREQDERVNEDYAALAVEYDLPLWNFWAAVQDLPGRGVYTRRDRPLQGDIYLTPEAQEVHRLTGLQALDRVWRAATGR